MTTLTTFNTVFHFRPVAPSHAKFTETKAAFDAAQVAYSTDKDGRIQRKSIEASLPLVTAAELPAEFLQDQINKLVEATARKLYVDNLQPVGEITVAQIVEANTPSERVSGVPAESWSTFVATMGAVLQKLGAPAATCTLITTLIKAKYAPRTLSQYQQHSESFGAILEKVASLASGVIAQGIELPHAQEILQHCASNLEQWITTLETAELSLDF